MGILGTLTACIAEPPKPFSNEVSPLEAIAEVTEIPSRPVWIRFMNTSTDSPVELGAAVKAGESIRTAVNSRAQIALKNGVILRLGGDSDVNIDNKLQVQFNQGRVIVSTGKDLTTEIINSRVIATVSNATVYTELLKNQNQQFFVLQGTATIKLKNSLQPITLKTGQNLIINADGTSLPVTVLKQVDLDKRFQESKLLSGFSSKLASQGAIEANFQISNVPQTVKIPYTPSDRSPHYEDYRQSSKGSRREEQVEPVSSKAQPEASYAKPSSAQPLQPQPEIFDSPPIPAQPEAFSPAEPPPVPTQPEAEANPP